VLDPLSVRGRRVGVEADQAAIRVDPRLAVAFELLAQIDVVELGVQTVTAWLAWPSRRCMTTEERTCVTTSSPPINGSEQIASVAAGKTQDLP
jgi:hypothetical protein